MTSAFGSPHFPPPAPDYMEGFLEDQKVRERCIQEVLRDVAERGAAVDGVDPGSVLLALARKFAAEPQEEQNIFLQSLSVPTTDA